MLTKVILTILGSKMITVIRCMFADFGIENKPKPEQRNDLNPSSPLLVLLVTCLILCLLIVVIFFAIKLRRAHLAWKRGNICFLSKS